MECDALITITNKSAVYAPYTCCGWEATWISVENSSAKMSVPSATIVPSTKEKEVPNMETQTLAPEYNSDLMITYKKHNGYSDSEIITDSIKNIEWELSNSRHNAKTVSALNNQIYTVKQTIIEAFADSNDQETLSYIAQALDIELTKQISFSATITVEGNITVSLVEDYDLDSLLADELTVDSSNGDIEIEDYSVDNVRESF
jgi:hypothetical protein